MQHSKIFSTNFSKLAVMLLPTMLRTPILTAFSRVAVSGVAMLHAKFMHYRRQVDFRLSHNGQRCYLRGALNERYDPIERRIRIGEGTVQETLMVWHRGEERQLFLPVLMPRRNFTESGFDFMVLLPPELFADSNIVERVRATTNTFKLASKTFEIIPI